ncbi:MAG: hypothetical protein AVDCRST_MAG19-897, partial [uncultured Thermomicrobiales bacterium]
AAALVQPGIPVRRRRSCRRRSGPRCLVGDAGRDRRARTPPDRGGRTGPGAPPGRGAPPLASGRRPRSRPRAPPPPILRRQRPPRINAFTGRTETVAM